MTGASRRGLASVARAAPDHALRSSRSAATLDPPAHAEAEAQQDEPQDEQVIARQTACGCMPCMPAASATRLELQPTFLRQTSCMLSVGFTHIWVHCALEMLLVCIARSCSDHCRLRVPMWRRTEQD